MSVFDWVPGVVGDAGHFLGIGGGGGGAPQNPNLSPVTGQGLPAASMPYNPNIQGSGQFYGPGGDPNFGHPGYSPYGIVQGLGAQRRTETGSIFGNRSNEFPGAHPGFIAPPPGRWSGDQNQAMNLPGRQGMVTDVYYKDPSRFSTPPAPQVRANQPKIGDPSGIGYYTGDFGSGGNAWVTANQGGAGQHRSNFTPNQGPGWSQTGDDTWRRG